MASSTCMSPVCLQADPSPCEKHPPSSARTLFHPAGREPAPGDGIFILRETDCCKWGKSYRQLVRLGTDRNAAVRREVCRPSRTDTSGLPYRNTCFRITDPAARGCFSPVRLKAMQEECGRARTSLAEPRPSIEPVLN